MGSCGKNEESDQGHDGACPSKDQIPFDDSSLDTLFSSGADDDEEPDEDGVLPDDDAGAKKSARAKR